MSIDQLSGAYGGWLDMPANFGAGRRARLFTPSITFWMFLSQVLAAGGCCREALRMFQVWLLLETGQTASPNTAAYCKARTKLHPGDLQAASGRVACKLEAAAPWRWLGRRVKVVDGTGLSMPDTPENQAEWPQPSGAKQGCGFPVMRVAALFSLGTGALLGLAHGALKVHERTLGRALWRLLEPGDVLLGDRGFCGLADFYFLALQGVDCVMRKHGRRKNARVVRRLGKGDRIVEWRRSGARPKWIAEEVWRSMPESILVREVRVDVSAAGFRSQTIYVATTLLDARAYPASELAALYLRRWKIEVFLRDIKATMGMDILTCRTPHMVENEMWMFAVAYNLIRAAMLEASLAAGTPIDRISFKGTLSALRQWADILVRSGISGARRQSIRCVMLLYIANDRLPHRPGRTEPRARKRRPKNYQLLNKPRALFTETPHRTRHAKP